MYKYNIVLDWGWQGGIFTLRLSQLRWKKWTAADTQLVSDKWPIELYTISNMYIFKINSTQIKLGIALWNMWCDVESRTSNVCDQTNNEEKLL